MAKGDILINKFQSYEDRYTKRIVTKLTPDEYLCNHPYFQNKMFTNDSRHLIYSSMVNGIRNMYMLDLKNEISIQLTDDKPGLFPFRSRLTTDDKFMIYQRDREIFKLDINTLKEERVYAAVEGWKNGCYDLSKDNRFLVTFEMNEEDCIRDNSNWDDWETQMSLKPLCRLVYVDVNNKQRRIIFEDRCWMEHPQIRPYDNDMILFCHEGPPDKTDARMWLINSDGNNLRCAKQKINQKEVVTHEYWLEDGSKFLYVYRPSMDSNMCRIRTMNPETLIEEEIMVSSKYCHFISNKDNSLITGDGKLEDQAYIYIVDVKKKEEYKLCWHGTSWKSYGNTQDCHPHPAFTPDGENIVFTSDMDGLPGIYIVNL